MGDYEETQAELGILTRPCRHGDYAIGFLLTWGLPETGQHSETGAVIVIRNVN